MTVIIFLMIVSLQFLIFLFYDTYFDYFFGGYLFFSLLVYKNWQIYSRQKNYGESVDYFKGVMFK